DEYAEDWARLVWVRLDGTAEILTAGPARDRGRKLLEAKYAQYAALPLDDAPIVRIAIEHVSEWHALLRISAPMDFGFTLKPDHSLERVVSLTRLAESAGFRYGWLFDSHVLWKEPYVLLTLMAQN